MQELQEEETACMIPTPEMLGKDENLKMLETHLWTVENSIQHGRDGILLRIRCKNCGLRGVSMILGIKQSLEKARRYREELELLS
jgi:hypothetical protein